MGLIANETPVVYGDNNNVKTALKIKQKANSQKVIIPFLEEIKELAKIDEDGSYAKSCSIETALKFGELLLKSGLKIPILDLFPTKEVAFVWRHKERGIMTILFEKTGNIIFTCYFSTTEASRKGNFKEISVIPSDIKIYIETIAGT